MVCMKATLEKYKGLYIIPPQKREKRKDWRAYLIPTGWKRRKNISEHIDTLLYGA